MTIMPDTLLAAGFKTSPVEGDRFLVGGVVYTLRETTNAGTCYVLEARFFIINGVPRLQFEARLYLDPTKRPGVATNTGFTVQLHDALDLDFERVRVFFADAYHLLGCRLDPHA